MSPTNYRPTLTELADVLACRPLRVGMFGDELFMLSATLSVTEHDDVMVIRIGGFMPKGLMRDVRTLLQRARENARAVMLVFDSPGGTARGTADLADDVAATAAEIPVVAFVEDLAASAAYFVASQAREIVANQPEALVGSLGTLLVIKDSSMFAEKQKIKVHVISTGEFKGAGTPGAPVTDAQLADFQREVNIVDKAFRRAVQRGRRMTNARLNQVFDGRIRAALDAIKLRLVDRIASFDDTLERLIDLN